MTSIASHRDATRRSASLRGAPPRTEAVKYILPGKSIETASKVGRELERLAAKGVSTPEGIVTAAKRENSPLHPIIFALSPQEAEHEHRLSLARHLARNVLVRETIDGVTRVRRAFYAVRVTSRTDEPAEPVSSFGKQPPKHYITVAAVRENPDYSAQVIEEARRMLFTWRDRFADYGETFGEVFELVDEMRDRLEA